MFSKATSSNVGGDQSKDVESVEHLALQVLSKYKTSPGPLFGYQRRQEFERPEDVEGRQSRALEQLYTIFHPLIGKAKKGDVNMNYIRAWWRTEVVVRFCEDDVVSPTGEVALGLLNDELCECGEGEYAFKSAFLMEELGKTEPPSIPSEDTNSFANASDSEQAAFNRIIGRVRKSEKQSDLNRWTMGGTLPAPPLTLDASTMETYKALRRDWLAKESK